VGGSTGSASRFQAGIERKLALRELSRIANVTEEIISRKILRVRLNPGTDPSRVQQLIDTVKPDYDSVDIERTVGPGKPARSRD
jgi:hypothetical protein